MNALQRVNFGQITGQKVSPATIGGGFGYSPASAMNQYFSLEPAQNSFDLGKGPGNPQPGRSPQVAQHQPYETGMLKQMLTMMLQLMMQMMQHLLGQGQRPQGTGTPGNGADKAPNSTVADKKPEGYASTGTGTTSNGADKAPDSTVSDKKPEECANTGARAKGNGADKVPESTVADKKPEEYGTKSPNPQDSRPYANRPGETDTEGVKDPLVTREYTGGTKGSITGDPHFTGFDGETYDVMGEAGKTYNLLSDKGVQVNGKFVQWGDKGATVLGSVGLTVGDSKIQYDNNGAPSINGETMEKGRAYQLDDGGVAVWDGNKLTVRTDEYDINVTQRKDPKGNYLNVAVEINEGGPMADGVAPDGLLGQTADNQAGKKQGDLGLDQGQQGGTVIDGVICDYEEGGLFTHDSKTSRYGAEVGNVQKDKDGVSVEVQDPAGNIIYKDPARKTEASNHQEKKQAA
jgi:hypothetical protein